MVHAGYLRTCLNIDRLAAEKKVQVDFLVTEGESHVTRARNNLVATFLNETDYDTLVFIDADIEMQAEDFFGLIDIPGVRGAAVACKTPDRAEVLSIWVNGARPTRAELPSESFPVEYLGSAVLAIDRSVFVHLRDSEGVSAYNDPIVGIAWDFFRDGVYQDTWFSEDYGFCALCQDEGVEIICDPSVHVKHYGSTSWCF
jgi:hypothetical protein